MIDETMRKKAAKDAKRLEHLRARAGEREKVIEKKKASNWSDRLAKMREKHPNAYKPWTPADDALLSERFQNGDDLKALGEKLGRHERSIIMRIQKLFGEDAVQLPS